MNFISELNFHLVVDVCFCLLHQLLQFMKLLRYLWHQHLKADRLMISMLVAAFISLIWNSSHGRTHTPRRAFVLLFMTQVSRRHRLFSTDWLCCGFLFFCCPSWQHTTTFQRSPALIGKKETYFQQYTSPHLPVSVCNGDANDWVQFYSILFLHCGLLHLRVLM